MLPTLKYTESIYANAIEFVRCEPALTLDMECDDFSIVDNAMRRRSMQTVLQKGVRAKARNLHHLHELFLLSSYLFIVNVFQNSSNIKN